MSLTTLHKPKLSLTSSYGSNLNLAVSESDILLQRSPRQQRHIGPPRETTPLIGTKKRAATSIDEEAAARHKIPPPLLLQQEQISLTLLITISVVTLGSSFQFGYGTSKSEIFVLSIFLLVIILIYVIIFQGTGVMNNSEAFMLDYFHNRGMNYTLVGWSITVSCYGIGGLLGSIIGPKVIGRYCGRKSTLLYNNIFLVISSYLIIKARAWWWQAIGRIFVGIVAGVATAVVPTYFSELSPIAIRGAVGTMHQLGITVGIVVSQWLSTPSLHIFGSEDQWQNLFVVPLIFGLLQCVILPFCPESPSYLYQTQGREAATKSLRRLQPDNDGLVSIYLDLIRDEIQAVDDDNTKRTLSTMELFRDEKLRKQLIVGIAVQLMMQFSGIDAVFYYSTSIFYQAEVYNPELATTLLGIINVLVTIVAVKYMDSAGRKRLLTISWIGLLASYAMLTMSFVLKPYYGFMDKVSSAFGLYVTIHMISLVQTHMQLHFQFYQISVVATTGVIIFFAFGPGCIAWFIIAEIFPLYARDTAMAV